MPENIEKQLNNQILIFLGLSVVNLIFAAITLAMGIMFVVNNLPFLNGASTLSTISLFYIITGSALAFIGFWWILSSTTLMDFISDIQWQSSKKKGEESYDDKVIGLIIKIVSYYRENIKHIKKMILISRAGGIFFIINGSISSIDLLLKVNDSFELTIHIMQFFAIILMFGWGIVSLLIPYFIKRFASDWEYRVKKTREAEEILRKHLESQ